MEALERAIHDSGFNITSVICGKARGVDTMGEQWAIANGIPVEYFPADWERYGKKAGMLRNQEMANEAQALIALWDFRSPGTRNMIYLANIQGLSVHVKRI